MFTEERQQAIIQLLNQNGSISVRDLSVQFDVTADCIRKDLKALENGGFLKRTYGGAILSKDYELGRELVDRRNVNQKEKRDIARKAVKLIQSGETIFLDASTTNLMLAQLLVHTSLKLIVVSNMLDILETLTPNPALDVVGTGGMMNSSINGFLGIEAARSIQMYSFDRGFFGCCGIDQTDMTLTTLGAVDGLTKQTALKACRHKYIMMDHSKFDSNECYKFASLDDIDAIVTDREPLPELKKLIEAEGGKII